jgi:hypothetical protein
MDPNQTIELIAARGQEQDGVSVEVSIIRLEHETEWSLEVVNSARTSIVWDDLFASDDEAFAEFERTVAEEGMRTRRRRRTGTLHAKSNASPVRGRPQKSPRKSAARARATAT